MDCEVQYLVYRECGVGVGREIVDGSLEMTRETRESWYNDRSCTPEWTVKSIRHEARL